MALQIPKTYTIKITLQGSKPPIWRKLTVWSDLYLNELHWVLQAAMGWDNAHLYEYTANREVYTEVDEEQIANYPPQFRPKYKDVGRFQLHNILNNKTKKIEYVYDFGDNWVHTIELVDIDDTPKDEKLNTKLISGRMACPPEDCGGIYGYYDMLDALKDKKHPMHADYMEWMGDEIDPKAYDKVAIQHRLDAVMKMLKEEEG